MSSTFWRDQNVESRDNHTGATRQFEFTSKSCTQVNEGELVVISTIKVTVAN